jgi:hypothetical protein
MLSVPPATATATSPRAMLSAASWMDLSPEPQAMFTV